VRITLGWFCITTISNVGTYFVFAWGDYTNKDFWVTFIGQEMSHSPVTPSTITCLNVIQRSVFISYPRKMSPVGRDSRGEFFNQLLADL
jgi:hypothetical protein